MATNEVLKKLIANRAVLQDKVKQNAYIGSQFEEQFRQKAEAERKILDDLERGRDRSEVKIREDATLTDAERGQLLKDLEKQSTTTLSENQKKEMVKDLKDISKKVESIIKSPTEGDRQVLASLASLEKETVGSKKALVAKLMALTKKTDNAGLAQLLEDLKESSESGGDVLVAKLDDINRNLTEQKFKLFDADRLLDPSRGKVGDLEINSDLSAWGNMSVNKGAFLGDTLELQLGPVKVLSTPLTSGMKGLLTQTISELKFSGLSKYSPSDVDKVLQIYAKIRSVNDGESLLKGKVIGAKGKREDELTQPKIVALRNYRDSKLDTTKRVPLVFGSGIGKKK
jgi:hypothetical protein